MILAVESKKQTHRTHTHNLALGQRKSFPFHYNRTWQLTRAEKLSQRILLITIIRPQLLKEGCKCLTPERRGSCHSWTKGKALSLQEGGKCFLLFSFFLLVSFFFASQKERASSSLWLGVHGKRRLESPSKPLPR